MCHWREISLSIFLGKQNLNISNLSEFNIFLEVVFHTQRDVFLSCTQLKNCHHPL